jgi:hypothetical protein
MKCATVRSAGIKVSVQLTANVVVAYPRGYKAEQAQ